ncbi:MAG TPA: Rpn family recombination-promoting nuclease/putative transposase [Pseudoduganella sp.]
MAFLNDTGCKQIFSFPEFAKELLCAAVDCDWAQSAPLSSFERVNSSYVSVSGKLRYDDIVWCLHRASESDLYFLVEFQSRPDNQLLVQTVEALVSVEVCTVIGSPALPVAFSLGEVIEMLEHQNMIFFPVGQVKFPHLWPGQNPPGRTDRIVVHHPAAGLVSPA